MKEIRTLIYALDSKPEPLAKYVETAREWQFSVKISLLKILIHKKTMDRNKKIKITCTLLIFINAFSYFKSLSLLIK